MTATENSIDRLIREGDVIIPCTKGHSPPGGLPRKAYPIGCSAVSPVTHRGRTRDRLQPRIRYRSAWCRHQIRRDGDMAQTVISLDTSRRAGLYTGSEAQWTGKPG